MFREHFFMQTWNLDRTLSKVKQSAGGKINNDKTLENAGEAKSADHFY